MSNTVAVVINYEILFCNLILISREGSNAEESQQKYMELNNAN